MSDSDAWTTTPDPPEPLTLAKLRHDLRTPLNQIIGYSEMLVEDAPEALVPDLKKIHQAAMNLLASLDGAFEYFGKVVDGGATVRRPSAGKTPVASPVREERKASGEHRFEGEARLLVVDDNENNRDMLARRLSRRGFSVEQAGDGEHALELLAKNVYDLVLLDVMMPGISGIDVLRQIRKTKSMVELPVIMATARDGSDDVVEALQFGANDYVTKPIDLPVVLARTSTQLMLKRLNVQVRELAEQLEARNKFIRGAFGRYLTDEVVESLLETPEGLALGGEARKVTIMMSDLRGFSSLSERLAPAQVITLLNHYLGVMTEVIHKHSGTIDEFIGDAILVIFGAPVQREDDARRAVACAVEMQLAMEKVNAFSTANDLPAIEMGIGINTGEVVVGNIGSDRRAKYGVVGRNVNLASRIEAYTVGGQVLVSESTREEIGDALRVRQTLEVHPKGSKEPMTIYEVDGIGDLRLRGSDAALVALASPLAVEFAVLDGVHAPEELHAGRITRASAREAVVESATPALKMSTVRLVLLGKDSDIYGKVLSTAAGAFTVHFTSIPPELRRELVARR